MTTVIFFSDKKICNDILCRQVTDMYVCEGLFDEVVKIKFSPQAKCHEELARLIMLVADQNRHLYSVSFNSSCQRAVLCDNCAGAFMIIADGKMFYFISRQSCVLIIIK